jgi:acyl carrier protein
METMVLIRMALREVAPGADLDRLDPATDLRDALGLDTLDFLRFVELLSEQSGRRIDEDDYPRLTSLSGAAAFLGAAAHGAS